MMAVGKFGYDKQAAQRRVNAVMLSIDLPEVLEKIDQGAMCLQSAADVQTFFNKQRGAKRAYSVDQKRDLLNRISNLSTREVQVELARLDPTIEFRESKKPISNDRTQITYTASNELEEKIERIKNLTSHINPYMTREDVLDFMAEKTLDAIDPLRKAQRSVSRRQPQSMRRSKSQHDSRKTPRLANNNGLKSTPKSLSAQKSFSAQRVNFSEEVVSEVGEIQLVAPFEESTRYIPAEEAHQVWLKNGDSGCEYVDPVTSQRCGSKHLLQRDHLREYSRGGSHDHENLQLMCGPHNRWRWRKRSTLRESRMA